MKIILAISLMCLVGCACTRPDQNATNAAHYGGYVSQETGERLAKAYFREILKDPYSAQYRFDRITRGWIQDAPIDGCKTHYGYLLRVGVNAKNSYGGYTGEKPYAFIIRDGGIVKVSYPPPARY